LLAGVNGVYYEIYDEDENLSCEAYRKASIKSCIKIFKVRQTSEIAMFLPAKGERQSVAIAEHYGSKESNMELSQRPLYGRLAPTPG
jgi:hypothetical protein